MPGTIVTLVLYVVALGLVVTNLYLRFQARKRKASAYSSFAFLNALLRALRREADTIERKGDVEFAALIVRFECIRDQARPALSQGYYNLVNELVDNVGRELAVFRQAEEQKRASEKK